ncbi:MAG TPA: hypothetical protein VGI27_01350 [Solirubrobacteraceae bacterium]
MQTESTLSRSLWTIVLTIVVFIVVVSYARQPLYGAGDEAVGFGPSLTLWVAGADSGGQTLSVATQAASCWGLHGHSTTVGVLPGGSATAVAEFLAGVRGKPDELLLITSTTLADIAHDQRDPLLGDESRERALRAQRLLVGAAPIAVLASDPLTLAVAARSSIHTTGELLQRIRNSTSRPLLDVAADSWLRGNLAALVERAGVRGEAPYGVFSTSREAITNVTGDREQVAIAPYSAVRTDLRSGRLRQLQWPAAGGRAPRTWMAILAPSGLRASEVAALRSQARGLCAGSAWSELLRADGLSPVAPGAIKLSSFVPDGIREATRLQTLAGRIMRDYG